MKQPIQSFPVGTRVQNTQQISFYYGRVGVVVEVGNKGKNSCRVQYDEGGTETHTGPGVWLAPAPDAN